VRSDGAAVTRPLPLPDADTEPFWAGTRDQKLLIQHCARCERAQFYPRYFCTECAGDVEWVEASGRGTVYTYSIVRQNLTPPFDTLVPYVLAMIDLDEGARMMGNVTGIDVDDVRIGMPVEVYFARETDEVWLPMWRTAAREHEGSR
jgi:uncharacterized OB-fold protein